MFLSLSVASGWVRSIIWNSSLGKRRSPSPIPCTFGLFHWQPTTTQYLVSLPAIGVAVILTGRVPNTSTLPLRARSPLVRSNENTETVFPPGVHVQKIIPDDLDRPFGIKIPEGIASSGNIGAA